MNHHFWNERYSESHYVYGEAPNVFFAEQLDKLPIGNLILPCEGEGRNAVYAATKGWQVQAFDSSDAGKVKALQLASKHQVAINYAIEDATKIEYAVNSVDVVAFVFAHFPPAIRQAIHHKAITWLKPGGKIIMEAFNPQQLQYSSGGPKNADMLYTTEMLQDDFKSMQIDCLHTTEVILNEGPFHQGKAAVIQMVVTRS